ncbi:hypothetical protein ODZ84_18360 [Chryseobacterium fluminis]|uniref:hypothetical protein n=1 Tax=Chryseobacterium fluminis TaxID=2983606 RepID=UPI00225215DB|nr:hypothetical protein [Chryseobacterium sp. MMS21-Ot14]UZT97143.1 hypothetical protein ODZ84_18360 [Chryseobacterium sp. MMS21-Ot14]
MMNVFGQLEPYFSQEWKEKYNVILAEEHVKSLSENIQKFKERTLNWDQPSFIDELKIDRENSFKKFIGILESQNSEAFKTKKLEETSFEHWLNILGQRLTPASQRDQNAVPPLKDRLIEACEKPFNHEITMAQRAWEKHVGRRDDRFWGEIKGNNQQKQQLVMEKISYILDHKTWWNVFFHYKHQLVYEVREEGGHGIRWSHSGTNLIGFLEVFNSE